MNVITRETLTYILLPFQFKLSHSRSNTFHYLKIQQK